MSFFVTTGKNKYPNGNIMEGTWTDGLRNGIFIFTFPNGERYQAIYVKGIRNGEWEKMDPIL